MAGRDYREKKKRTAEENMGKINRHFKEKNVIWNEASKKV